MTLTEFLLARIAEDEAAAKGAAEQQRSSYYWGGDTSEGAWREGMEGGFGGAAGVLGGRYSPSRVLAECEARRRIVADRQRIDRSTDDSDWSMGYSDANYSAMSALAQPYADHPDFDPVWRP